MTDNKHRYIAIEGPIGVGKTTLARKLSDTYQAELQLENAEDNPFLEQFYKTPKTYALATQLSFLMQRLEQIEQARQADIFAPRLVSDFLLEKDYLFAQNTLSDLEMNLYDQVYTRIVREAPIPDLVIYLQAPVDTLLARIRKRNREFELQISPQYLERLSQAYTDFFHHYNKAPLLIVNATEIDIPSNSKDYQQLLERIEQVTYGRHYFNPLPFALGG